MCPARVILRAQNVGEDQATARSWRLAHQITSLRRDGDLIPSRSGVPIPKFASCRAPSFANFGIEGPWQLIERVRLWFRNPHGGLAAKVMRTLRCLIAAGGLCGGAGFLLCENLPEVGSQPPVVTGKHLVQGALVLVRGSPG